MGGSALGCGSEREGRDGRSPSGIGPRTRLPCSPRLLDQHADDGLVVIGVHDKEGWDEVAPFAESAAGLRSCATRTAPCETLKVDQDPDIYVIDRVGNMRYADITTETATEAVETLLGEDQTSAADADFA